MSPDRRFFIADLVEGAFFGDYQILFGLPSNYFYVSSRDEETWCMSI
jgi:hypothetical protein